MKCPHCKEIIPSGMVQQGGLHMGCYETEIDVYFISISEVDKSGFYENDLNSIKALLDAMDEGEMYIVSKKKIKAGIYYNAPEFTGF